MAHSEKRSRKFLFISDIDPNFHNNHPKLKLLSILVIFYIDCIFENFPDIIKNAELSRKLKIQHSKKRRNNDSKKLEKYQNDIQITIQDVNSNLEKNGFKVNHLQFYFLK